MWRPSNVSSVLMCILLIATVHMIYLNSILFKKKAFISPEEKKEKKYVILAGPGKTASTSIQFNLYRWSESGWLGHDWAWMQPNLTCLREESRIYCPSFRYVLVHNPWYWKAWGCLGWCLFDSLENKNATEQCTRVKSCFTDDLHRKQNDNNQTKLVFGTEWIASSLVDLSVKGRNTSFFIQGFVDTIPSSSPKEEITFVVTYRSPKIDHLRSWWKQINANRKKLSSFRSLLLAGDIDVPVIDPLYAAKEIATRHGFNVVVIDMSGVKAKGLDISSVVACQVLENVPCHGDTITLLLGGNESTPGIKNIRSHTMEDLNDLTLDETLQIADALQKLDCNSVHDVFDHPRIQVLYPYDLNNTLHSCRKNQPFYSHEQLKKEVQSIVSKEL